MSERKPILVAALEVVAAYIATHPDAAAELRRKFWYYTRKGAHKVYVYAGEQYTKAAL
jgi:hypothetical protein